MPYPRKLESVERAIAVVLSYVQRIPEESYLSVIAQVELARAKRLQAEKALRHIWLEQGERLPENEDEENNNEDSEANSNFILF